MLGDKANAVRSQGSEFRDSPQCWCTPQFTRNSSGRDSGAGRARADLPEQHCPLPGDRAGIDAEPHAPGVPHQHLGPVQRGRVVDGVARGEG
jgi:hypothetical protein